ncbi:ion transporter [Flavobacteriaceae bacterium R38]|nr:ion transporter [Flavobacteriaceae bacterium R38]
MTKTKRVEDPGFGKSSIKNVKRFVNKDGTFNIRHVNNKNSIYTAYTYLVNISWLRFFFLVLLGYIIVNSFFAIIYLLIGVEDLHIENENWFFNFLDAFFFSAQTITTVGYGGMSPTGVLSGIVSTLEALIGLLSFSFITGLLYGRFVKPRSFIAFSDKIIHRPFNDNSAIMFRLMNTKKRIMINPKASVTLSLMKKNGKEYQTNFFNLSVERKQISYLPTTWTIVHEIDDESPFKGYSKKEIKELTGELIILISYFDESFNQEVYQVYSYTLDELIFDVAFKKAFEFDENGITVLDHEKLNATYKLDS